MVDYRDEIRLGKEVLARTVEAYRKIRNTFRYLLSNLYDFDPATDAVTRGEMLAVDRYALSTYARLAGDVRRAYEGYDFQAIFHAINEFVTVDLSAFYLDVSKDRLYTFGARSRERRSAQTAVMTIADGLTRLLAPILSVTTDEIWRQLPGARDASVHLATFPDASATETWRDETLDAEWRQLLDLRGAVNAALEGARQRKEIGNALSAHVAIAAGGSLTGLLQKYREDLPMLFITSDVAITASGAADPVVTVTPATGEKCPRCWRYVPEVVTGGAASGVCRRCADAVTAMGDHAN